MISGYVCIRNNFELDYMAHLTVKSMLPVCDEVVVCDSDSSDLTRPYFEDWAEREPKLRVINRLWANEVGKVGWMVRWMNYAREQLKYPTQLYLDSDEVLDPACYAQMRSAAASGVSACFERNTYFKDARHMSPLGFICSHRVVRMGATNLWMPIDGPTEDEHPNVATHYVNVPGLLIHHYGFLRNPDAFYRKASVVQTAFFGSLDARAEKAYAEQDNALEGVDWFDGQPLRKFQGSHPTMVHDWLRERGYTP